MTEDRASAIEALRSQRPSERLNGARFLVRAAVEQDVPVLRAALGCETSYWVRAALQAALDNVGAGVGPDKDTETGVSEVESLSDAVSEAIGKVANMLLHELRPVVGRIDVYAAQEIENYSGSRVSRQVESLQRRLEAIELLSRAAGVPLSREFDMPAMVRRVVTDLESDGVEVKLAGAEPLTLASDESLVELILSQGLRNAIEASEAQEAERRWVLVTWGATDRDYWLRVADHGNGPPAAFAELATWGRASSKPGHLGYGLAIATRAAISLRGSLELVARNPIGSAFSFRWPK